MPNVQLPDGSVASFPDGTSQDEMMQAIEGHLGQSAPPRDALAPTPNSSGSILPISSDAQGNPHFDPSAGILGMLFGAAKLPGDVYTGKTPIMVDDKPNSDMIRRSVDLAGLMSPASPAMRAGEYAIPGEMRAGTVPGVVSAPSATQLKKVGGAGYDAARNSGIDIQGDAVAQLAHGLRSTLDSKGFISERAPETHAILDRLSNPPEGGFVSVDGILSIREALSDISRDNAARRTDAAAAGKAIREMDGFLGTLGPQTVVAGTASPEDIAGLASTLKDARGNYAAAHRANALTGELDRANTGIGERAAFRAQATNSGQNLDNAIRQRVASLLEKPKDVSGYSDAELEALRNVVNGGFAQNRARDIGNFFGGGRGLGGAVTTGLGAAAGAGLGGGPGAAIGAVAPAVIGMTAKSIENALAKRSLNSADELIRMNSPLYRDLLAQAPPFVPSLDNRSLLLRMLGIEAIPGAAGPTFQTGNSR